MKAQPLAAPPLRAIERRRSCRADPDIRAVGDVLDIDELRSPAKSIGCAAGSSARCEPRMRSSSWFRRRRRAKRIEALLGIPRRIGSTGFARLLEGGGEGAQARLRRRFRPRARPPRRPSAERAALLTPRARRTSSPKSRFPSPSPSLSMSKAMTRFAANSVRAKRPPGRRRRRPASFSPTTARRAMRRGDQRRAVRRDEAAQNRAAGLHQLRRHHDVDIAGRRHQRQHRR